MYRTEIESTDYDFKFNHKDRMVSIGSCFSDSIGLKLKKAKFKIKANPFGTIFNPLSIFNLLNLVLTEDSIQDESIIERDGLFLSHDLHSSFKAKSPHALKSRFGQISKSLKKQLQKADLLIITFGTSWVYEKKRSKELVSNCHKVPQKEFEKRLLSLEEILSNFFTLKEKLDELNPQLKILLTVSPIRHTKDGLSGNSVSKSNLLLACHYLKNMAHAVYYFPSYEMIIDDLRDYRFFEKDMIHPNDQAIDYVWHQFMQALMDAEAQKLTQELKKLTDHLDHKPFNPKSEAHQKFLRQTLAQAEELNQKVNLKKEIKNLKSKINNDRS